MSSLSPDGEQAHGAQGSLEHRAGHRAPVEAVEVTQRRGKVQPPSVDFRSELPATRKVELFGSFTCQCIFVRVRVASDVRDKRLLATVVSRLCVIFYTVVEWSRLG